MAKCEGFIPFPSDLEVCDACGELGADHPNYGTKQIATEFREDLWKVMLKYGCVPNFYGGNDTHEMLTVKVHLGVDLTLGERNDLARINDPNRPFYVSYKRIDIPAKPCRIDFARTTDPKMDTYAEFAGTDCGADRIPALVGELDCVCGALSFQDWVLKDKTMGQLMWLVAKEAWARD